MTPDLLERLRDSFIWACVIGAILHFIAALFIDRVRRRVDVLERTDPAKRVMSDYMATRANDKIRFLERDLKAANATINRVNALCVTAEDAPIEYRNSITTAALREAIDGQKPPVKPVRRIPREENLMSREEYYSRQGVTPPPKPQSPNTTRAGTPPAREWVKVQPKTAKHAKDPETLAQLERTRHDLTTAQARLSRIRELYQDWARWGEGAMSYKKASEDLLDAILIDTDTNPPNPVIDPGSIRP